MPPKKEAKEKSVKGDEGGSSSFRLTPKTRSRPSAEEVTIHTIHADQVLTHTQLVLNYLKAVSLSTHSHNASSRPLPILF
jgi:hypothetical protein